MEPKELLTISDIARELGVSRQVVWNWTQRDKMPPPDFQGGAGPLWKRATLEKAGVLE